VPKVPTYDSFQVAPSVQPNARFNAPQISDAPAQQMQQAGQSLMRSGSQFASIEVDAVNQANQTRVNDALNKAVESRLRLTYDPQGGYVHLRGNAALERPDGKLLDEEFTEKYQQQLNQIGESLGNGAQRQIFQQRAGELVTQFRGNLVQHVAKEFATYQDGVLDGTIKTNTLQMAASWGDPQLLTQSQEAIKAAVVERGRLQGLSGQQIEANMVAALSPGNMAVIQGAIDAGMTDYAKEYLTQHEKALVPEARLQAKKILDASDFETRAQTNSEKFMTEAGGDVSKALAMARENLTGKDEDAAVTRIKMLDAERVTLRERVQKDAADNAWRVYADTGSLRGIAPSIMSAMDGKDLDALRRTARADADAKRSRTEVKTDPNIYYALSMAAATNPNFKDEDLRRYFDVLSPGDRKHFIDTQAKMQRPGESEQIATAQQQIGAVIKSLNLRNEDAGLFTMEANKALFAAQQSAGKPLDDQQRQKVLDGLVLKGEVPGTIWNSSTMRFKANAEGQTFVPKFSQVQKNQATAALQRQGITNPTQEQIDAVLRATYSVK
jgi:hypothetical protein